MKPILLLLASCIIFWGCDKELNVDTTPPPPPQGIRTISLDNAVELQWLGSQAEDVKGYNVWISDQYDGRYTFIGSVSTTNFIDYSAVNGVTYYYAVSAYDFDDNESVLSKDIVYDTPRPEGYGVVLSDYHSIPGSSGYDFSQYTVLSFDDKSTDFFYDHSSGSFYLDVWDDTDIQDMGYTTSLDEITSSPTEGWAPSKSAEAILGHTYVLWTWDDHFAKIRVKEVNSGRLVVDWAYQTAEKNPELRIVRSNPAERMPLKRKLIFSKN